MSSRYQINRTVAAAEAEEAASYSVLCRVRQKKRKLSKIRSPGSLETRGSVRLGTWKVARFYTTILQAETTTPQIKSNVIMSLVIPRSIAKPCDDSAAGRLVNRLQ